MKCLYVLFCVFLATSAWGQTYQLFESTVQGPPAKTLLFVHGGGWVSGSPDDFFELGTNLRKRGICVALAGYGLAPAFKYPAQTNQLNEIIKNLQNEKSKICDFKRIYLGGHSAGAHIIADWAVRFKHKSVKGFLSFGGVYDIALLAKEKPEFLPIYILKEFGGEKNWNDASPARKKLLSKNPWLLVHSKTDELVNLNQSQLFQKHLLAQGINAELLELEGTSHGYTIMSVRKEDSPAHKKTMEFINK